MNPFVDQKRVFYNTFRQRDVEAQTRSVRPDMLSTFKLGYLIPHPPYNQYDKLYGHQLEKRPTTMALRPPIEADTTYWSQYPIPYTLYYTNNKLVDVGGALYVNEDLPVIPRRM